MDDPRRCIACGDDCETSQVFRSVEVTTDSTGAGVELVGPFCSMVCRDVYYVRLTADALGTGGKN